MTKGGISHAETRSKIGHRRVLKREVREDFSFFVPLAEVVVPVAARQTYLHSVDLEVGVQLFFLSILFIQKAGLCRSNKLIINKLFL